MKVLGTKVLGTRPLNTFLTTILLNTSTASTGARGLTHQLQFVVVGLVALALPAQANAAGYILGDSIGEGVAIASSLKGLAKIGIHIRGPKALAQIEQTPRGATVFIVLGTNDAEGSIKNIGKSIDDIVAAGQRKDLNMTWIGPPCVRKSWDTRARELDDILRKQLAGTAVKYVSMRDTRLCSGTFHEPDGIHLTMKGYHYMWDKVRAEVGNSDTAVAAAGADQKGAVANGEATSSVQSPTSPRSSPRPQTRVAEMVRTQGVGARVPAARRLVMEVHVPPAVPSAPLVWVRARD